MTVASFIGQALIGWLIADLATGLVHWIEDRVLTERTPFVAKIVEDNRRHHADPMHFTRSSFLSRNAASAGLSVAIALAWYAAFGWSVALAAATIGGTLSNEIHCWTHKRPGHWLRIMQDIGVIQSPRVHAGHHRPPQASRYCTLTDWCNPVLDALDVWARAERLLGIRADVRPDLPLAELAGGRGASTPLTAGGGPHLGQRALPSVPAPGAPAGTP